MKERFLKYKILVDDFLDGVLEEKREEFKGKVWGSELVDRIKEFAKRGKTVRGGLVLASYEIFSGKIDDNALKTAAAIELLHSALLIHDDIIDKDELRRGAKTIYAQYEDLGKEEGFEDAKHFGYGMAICAGDICISAVFELIESLDVEPEIKRRVIEVFSRGLNRVGLAEMDDLYMGYTKKPIEEERIIEMYRGKTASYTFGVPLISGVILAGQNEETISKMKDFADRLGIVFQIKDDELGIFGDEKELGKPIGSDISENKKTLFRNRLFEKADENETLELEKTFGNSNVDEEMVKKVREMIDKYEIRKEIQEMALKLDGEAREIVAGFDISADSKDFLEKFMDYNLKRNR